MSAAPAATAASRITAPARRLVAVLAGVGLVVVSAPALAAPRVDDESAALVLLADAAQASRSLTYSGTQYVASWGASAATSLVEVQHAPGRGVRVVAPAADGTPTQPVVVTSGALDGRLLDVLRDRYALRVAGEGRCTGRAAHVVEAHRPVGDPAGATVAARFWIDHETGLLLRREVFDAEGMRVRSSAFLDLTVAPPVGGSRPRVRAAAVRDEPGEPVSQDRLRALREAGQAVPGQLPGGFALFEARSRVYAGGEVLHLAYSDGLSTTSLFSQPGELGSAPPDRFTSRAVAGHPVWAAPGAPQRLVWSGGDRVWTLVSDAPDDAVDAAVAVLPHDALPTGADTGWRARLVRGASRLATALNPFR